MSLADPLRPILCGAFASLLMAFASLASADAPPEDPATQAAARALFDEARTLLATGHFAEACPKLAESFRLDAGAGTQINLGHCYEKNGQIASAWATFKDAASTARRAGRIEWAERAERRAALLEEQLPMLTIHVDAQAASDGVEIRRNGVVVAQSTWGSAIPVDPGKYTIDARAPSRRAWTYEVVIAAGDHLALELPRLQPEAPAAPAPLARVETPAPPPRTQRTAGIVVAVTGIVGIGVGIGTGAWAISANHEVDQRCPPGKPCRDSGAVSLSESASAMGNVSTVAFIAGGALLGLGGILFFTAPKRPDAGLQAGVAYRPGGGEFLLQSGF